jgi:hypothetical protein
MKLYNEDTGKFYVQFSSLTLTPIWTERGRPSQARQLLREEAEAIKRQLLALDPNLNLLIVE